MLYVASWCGIGSWTLLAYAFVFLFFLSISSISFAFDLGLHYLISNTVALLHVTPSVAIVE